MQDFLCIYFNATDFDTDCLFAYNEDFLCQDFCYIDFDTECVLDFLCEDFTIEFDVDCYDPCIETAPVVWLKKGPPKRRLLLLDTGDEELLLIL